VIWPGRDKVRAAVDQMENEKEMRNVSRALRFQSITVCSVRPSVNRPAKHVLHVGRFSKH